MASSYTTYMSDELPRKNTRRRTASNDTANATKETSKPAKKTTASKKDTSDEHKTKSGRQLKRVNHSEEDIQFQDTSIKDNSARSRKQSSADKSQSEKTSTDKSTNKKRTLESNHKATPRKTSRITKSSHQKLPLLDDTYILKHVLKGHTEINIPVRDKDDIEDSKDIWCCEFEPTASDIGAFDPQKPGQLQNVALCGSYTVLFADTTRGKYTKKYTHVETQEIFYCMAWTRLEGQQLLDATMFDDDDNVRFCNILAVAGRLGSVKLLSPLQNECYRYLFGHQKAILAMTFAKSEPRWLFTASADKTVRLWDIGSPTSKVDDSVCLARFNLPSKTGEPSAVSVSYDLSTLIVGCNNGDLVQFKITTTQLDEYRKKAEEFRAKKIKSDRWESMADVDQPFIYPAGDEWHEGYVDDVFVIGQDGDEESKLYNHIVSRGSEDMEILVWDPVGSTQTDAKIELSLDWPDAADCTGLRFKLIEKEQEKVLIAGDYDGQICIYDIGNSRKSKTLSDGSKEQFKPTRILSHGMSSEIIRDITCSYDTKTIVAVDNNNHMFIWTSSVS